MITCLIIDDEPLARELLKDYLADCPGIQCLGEFKNALEAREFLKQNKVDLLFLDINMPKLTGLDFLKTLNQKSQVILTTAYPEYALEGYELDVTDYLLKPFSFKRFLQAIQKAENNLKNNGSDEMIMVRADKRTWPIPLKEIVCIESDGDYVVIHTEKKKIMTYDTLKQLSDKLPSDKFQRVHKSWIVSLSHIEYHEGNLLKVGIHEIPIGKVWRDEVKKWLGNR